MKQKRTWISAIIVLIILIIIINFLPKLLFLRAMNDFIHLDSVHIEGNLTLVTLNHDLKLKGSANYTKDILYSTLMTDSKFYPVKLELYSLFHQYGTDFYLSTNLNKDWFSIRSELESENNSSNHISLKEIKIKKVKSDRKAEQKFQVTMSKKSFLSFLSKYLKDADLKNDSITLSFYMKKGKIAGLKWEENNCFYFSKNSDFYLQDIDISFTSWNAISNVSISDNIVENSKGIEKGILEIFFP